MRCMCFLKYKNGVTVTVGRTDPGKNLQVWQTKPNDKTGSNEYSGPICKYRYHCTKRQNDLVLEKKFFYYPRTEMRPKETEPESSPPSLIQRSAIGELNVAQAPPVVQDVLNSSGRAFDPATRGFMEDRFGRDFSGVRVHTDERAMKSAGMINARGYTSGSHIVFGAGGFFPGTHNGRRLISHELTHVVQQNRGSIALQRQP